MSFFFCPHMMMCVFFLAEKGNGTVAVPYDVDEWCA